MDLAQVVDSAQVDSRNHTLGANEPAWQQFLHEIEDFIKQ
jgi:hypothetical protein